MRLIALVPGLALLALAGCSAQGPQSDGKKPAQAQSTTQQQSTHRALSHLPSPSDRPVPPYHQSAEAAKPFPRLLPASYFRNYPLVARAYTIAAEIPEVIAQQPCYCYCDKFGHRSLLDCYASDHGAG